MTNSLISESCEVCHKPVYAHEGYNSITKTHWDCDIPRQEFVKSILIEQRKKKRAKAGTGPIAQKVIKKVELALLDAGYETVKVNHIWVQEYGYRGPKWDLAIWGGSAYCDNGIVNFHSWSTMTACAKSKKLVATDDGSLEYNIDPV